MKKSKIASCLLVSGLVATLVSPAYANQNITQLIERAKESGFGDVVQSYSFEKKKIPSDFDRNDHCALLSGEEAATTLVDYILGLDLESVDLSQVERFFGAETEVCEVGEVQGNYVNARYYFAESKTRMTKLFIAAKYQSDGDDEGNGSDEGQDEGSNEEEEAR